MGLGEERARETVGVGARGVVVQAKLRTSFKGVVDVRMWSRMGGEEEEGRGYGGGGEEQVPAQTGAAAGGRKLTKKQSREAATKAKANA